MTNSVYIETTIPNMYYEERVDAETVARRHWTRYWWDGESADYRLLTSAAVVEELSRGEHPNKDDKIALISSLPLLSIENDVIEIVEVYIENLVMPKDPAGDALHLALASYYKVDYLLTWNCSHLANANKFQHVRRVNTKLGLFTPALITPLNLLGDM